MELTISDDVLREAQMTPDELRVEIALLLYSKEKLSLEQAARLAGVGQDEFRRMMAAQALSSYDLEEYRKDRELFRNQ